MDKNELLQMLAQESSARRFAKGEAIVVEGQPATDGLAFLLAGEAKVAQTQNGKRILIGFIKAGQFFGETALVLARPRMASVEAASDGTIVLFIQADYFRTLASRNHAFLDMLIKHAISRIEFVMAALFRLKAAGPIPVDPSLQPIIAENRRQVMRLQDMLNHTRSAWIGVGKAVFHQGERNTDDVYLVVKGAIEAVHEIDGKAYPMHTFSEGDIFGYSRKSSTPVRRYSAFAVNDSARIITFDDELVGKLLRMNQEAFYYVFRSMITQLVMLDDALRLASARLSPDVGSAESESTILAALNALPPVELASEEPAEAQVPEPGCDEDDSAAAEDCAPAEAPPPVV